MVCLLRKTLSGCGLWPKRPKSPLESRSGVELLAHQITQELGATHRDSLLIHHLKTVALEEGPGDHAGLGLEFCYAQLFELLFCLVIKGRSNAATGVVGSDEYQIDMAVFFIGNETGEI